MCPQNDEKPKRRHYFFLNPYEDTAFTCCPQCNEKTKLRKFPLVVHVEPAQMLCLNMNCKYCVKCDLIIVKKTGMKNFVEVSCETINPALIGNKFLVIGTLDKADWRRYHKQVIYPHEVIDKAYIFKDVKHFEVVQGGWMKDK